jgi:RNA recognition motif-containing protein
LKTSLFFNLKQKIKRDGNGQSRGFGFIRFKNFESQLAVINKRHFIDGRHVDVKIPDSKVSINFLFIDFFLYEFF